MFYHITFPENVPSIQEHGLVCNEQVERKHTAWYTSTWGVFLAKTKDDAFFLAPPGVEYRRKKELGEKLLAMPGARYYRFEDRIFTCCCLTVDMTGLDVVEHEPSVFGGGACPPEYIYLASIPSHQFHRNGL